MGLYLKNSNYYFSKKLRKNMILETFNFKGNLIFEIQIENLLYYNT